MRGWIRRAFSRRRGRAQIPPSDGLVYGIYFAFAALIALTILEATYIIIIHEFSSEIFAAISLVIGTILGAFFGTKA